MNAEPIRSAFETPRACLACGRDFLPPRNARHAIADHCSEPCRVKIGKRLNNAVAAEARQPDRVPVLRRASARSHRLRLVAPRTRTTPRIDGVEPFGSRLARLRIAGGWHQDQLAQRTGFHVNSILGWERGKNEPSLSKAVALAAALDVSLDYLATGEGQP